MKKTFKFISSAVLLTLVFSVLASAASTNTIITRTSGQIKCSVSLSEIPEGSVIVVSALKDSRIYSCQFKSVTSNTQEEFFVDNDTNEVRVHVFENLSEVKPVTEGEKIEVKLDSVTDPDWSDWI